MITAGLEVVRHYIHADIPIVNGGNVVYNGTYFDPLTGINLEPAFQSFLQNQPLAFIGVQEEQQAQDARQSARYGEIVCPSTSLGNPTGRQGSRTRGELRPSRGNSRRLLKDLAETIDNPLTHLSL